MKDKALPRERCAALWKDRRTVFASIFLHLQHYPSNVIAKEHQHKFMLYRGRCRHGNKLSEVMVEEPEFQVESRERFLTRTCPYPA